MPDIIPGPGGGGVSQSQLDSAVNPLKPFNETITPTTGQTINLTGSYRERQLHLAHAATIAALTVNMPSDADSLPGDTVYIFTEKPITSFSVLAAVSMLPALVAVPADANTGWILTRLQGAGKWSVYLGA